MLEPETVRRLEVITGTGRRRRFSDDDKARIVEETLVPGAVVSAVARQYGLTPQQVFAWRRQARELQRAETHGPLFVPAVIETAAEGPRRTARRRKRLEPGAAAIIELEIDGVAMKIGRGADAKTVMAVIRALKAGA
jgi:transposase